MSVQEIVVPNNEGFLVSNRVLGAIGMILSPMLILAFFFAPQLDQPSPHPFLAGLGGVLYLFGAMASATGMRNLRVTGNGKGARVLYFVQMTGLLLAMCCDVLENSAPQLRETTVFFITDMAYPFSHILMIVVAVAVIRAGVWRGWRRIPAFLVGLALPSFFGLSAAVGRANGGFIFPLMVTVGFFLLGLAVFTTKTDQE
ncbi:MAG TPA: hypothetical protein VNB22_16095 [Pyrinomonadaceae bacterium]|nr:hypothetical protein [Pyrinomonadaceae bacterium]